MNWIELTFFNLNLVLLGEAAASRSTNSKHDNNSKLLDTFNIPGSIKTIPHDQVVGRALTRVNR